MRANQTLEYHGIENSQEGGGQNHQELVPKRH